LIIFQVRSQLFIAVWTLRSKFLTTNLKFWLENRVMIEFLTPEMANQYLTLMQPEKLQKAFVGSNL